MNPSKTDLIIKPGNLSCSKYKALIYGGINNCLGIKGGYFPSIHGKDPELVIRRHLGSYFGLPAKLKMTPL
ncbi:MAG: hypothetical protein A4E53_00325 [Pelotomaculum sp. PtaB.Bin104]|nr:MAG: hypothetical protein A4E53_00325 [Pelotomaculum sp. PtaB.Bin104]